MHKLVSAVLILLFALALNVEATTVGISTAHITSPSGGEIWTVGETHTITWTTEGDVSDIQIGLRDFRYDPNLGLGEETVAYKIPNTGYFEFTVPSSLGYLSGGSLNGDKYFFVAYPWEGQSDEAMNFITIQPAAVPEPGTIGLLAVTGVGLLLRRPRR